MKMLIAIKKYFWQFTTCVLLILLFLCRQCIPEPQYINSHTIDTITVVNPVRDTITEYKPGQKVHDTIYSEIPIDSLDVVTDYFKQLIADDTLRGENYMVAIHDIISRNRIQKRSAEVTVKEITKTIHEIDSIYYTTECPKLRNKVYVGFGVGGWTDKGGIAPSLALNTKKDNLYTGSYDLINRIAWIHMYWKIKIKK